MQIINITKTDEEVQVSAEEKAQRMSICETCEYNADQYCGQCYCILDVITGLKEKSCPVGKWNVSLL